MDDITRAFLEGIKDYPELTEALDIVKPNYTGKIWLIGGTVYRTIVRQLYGGESRAVDVDFILEEINPKLVLPEGWTETRNRSGAQKLVNGSKSIDIPQLKELYSIKYRHLPPSIEHYLSGVPLTVQSIAYDFAENRVIGEKGIDALRRRVVEVNDHHFAQHCVTLKGTTIRDYITEKARDLEFTAVYPD